MRADCGSRRKLDAAARPRDEFASTMLAIAILQNMSLCDTTIIYHNLQQIMHLCFTKSVGYPRYTIIESCLSYKEKKMINNNFDICLRHVSFNLLYNQKAGSVLGELLFNFHISTNGAQRFYFCFHRSALRNNARIFVMSFPRENTSRRIHI